jgi:hypothetical protein
MGMGLRLSFCLRAGKPLFGDGLFRRAKALLLIPNSNDKNNSKGSLGKVLHSHPWFVAGEGQITGLGRNDGRIALRKTGISAILRCWVIPACGSPILHFGIRTGCWLKPTVADCLPKFKNVLKGIASVDDSFGARWSA